MPSATMHPGSVRRALLGGTLFALAVAMEGWAEVPPMRVHFIDVGQGDATLFEFPCNKTVLVDTGGERNDEFDGRQALLAYLDDFFDARPKLNRTLSLLAITHPHRDHTQAVRAVLERYTVEGFVVNGRRSGSGWFFEEREVPGGPELPQGQSVLLDEAAPDRVRVIEFPRVEDVRARTDRIIDPVDCRSGNGDGVDPRIQVLWGEIDQDPGWGVEEFNGQRRHHFANANNHSVVLRVDYGDASVLLTGDLESKERPDGSPTAAIPDLLRRYGSQPGGLLDVDVYKVGHHGSANGTSEELLEAMRPQIAILSMGPDSRRGPWHDPFPFSAYQYGQPRKSVVEDLQRLVTLQRLVPTTRRVATGQRTFEPMRITRCIAATGWGGTVVVTAHADGNVEVAPAAGGGNLCATGPAPGAIPFAAESVAAPAPAEDTLVQPTEPRLLAPRPLCEASAALAAPGNEDLVLVADNERDEQLYVFEVDDDLVAEEVWQMPAKQRPNDVEALARLGQEVVVVGSHSRNSSCEVRENRQRLRRLTARPDGTLQATGFLDSAPAWKRAMENGGAQCVATLFVQPAPNGADGVCRALIAAEAGGERCEALNIEGAFGTADERLWLGLRSPLVDGRAVLLRLVPGLAELRFDSVALLNLEGRGIRELALDGDRLFGVAGPTLDVDEPFTLFRVATPGDLGSGEPAVEILRRDLLTSSEGLLVRGRRAFVLLDGDAGEEDGDPCETPAGWYSVELPP
jgi:competence protein ComEC